MISSLFLYFLKIIVMKNITHFIVARLGHAITTPLSHLSELIFHPLQRTGITS
jgi:hypothetical protein